MTPHQMRQDPTSQGTYRLLEKGIHTRPPLQHALRLMELKPFLPPSIVQPSLSFPLNPGRTLSETVLKVVIALLMTYVIALLMTYES